MKIIDINRNNGNLIVEVSQKEYAKIIIALEKVYPPTLIKDKRFKEDELMTYLKVNK